MDQATPSPDSASLRAELDRLHDKLLSTHDQDIRRALETRIVEVEEQLKAASDAVVVEQVAPQKLSREQENEFRSELARLSQSLYSAEDPVKRTEIQSRIKELQGVLGIDVNRLAGREMSQNAIPDIPIPSSKPKKNQPKPRVELADLQALAAEKSAQIRKFENNTEIDLPENPEPPTPEELAAAERLVQQARVEKMRSNSSEVRRLLEQAVRTAPGSPAVLEMLGDDYAERRQPGRALAYYRRAAKIDPKNVNLERKVAMSALGLNAASSEAQISQVGGLDDSAIPMASRKAATLLSLFLPGLGHIVLGQKKKGIPILVAWCLLLAWVILMGGDIAKLGAMITGGRSQPNLLVLVPMFLMVAVFIGTLASLKGSEETVFIPADRPSPPVNLPFE